MTMIRAVLIDLSGTLHIENNVIPGAIESLQRLRKTNLQVKFVTNTTKESKNFLFKRLTDLGFDLKLDEIFSSLSAARSLIIHKRLKPMLLLSPEALEDFEGLSCSIDEKPNAVVVGLAPSEFHYDRLNEAFRYLKGGAQLIAIHAGKYYKRDDGLALGPGCFIKGLEYSAQCTAELVGKPNAEFFRAALNGVAPHEAVMIGDDATDDIEGAMKAGMKGYLVQTGKYQLGDENNIETKPTLIVSSFVEAVDKILEEIDKNCI